ncbi:MAG: hypothetical protein PHX49_02660 [Bacteroidales bacterium]|nr:hypothetical protein [Bacteroidales bacterium]
MIREIINFTENLIEDIPDIMEKNIQPSCGLHVFIDIDDTGKWINQDLKKDRDYDYYDGKNEDISLWNECIKYQGVSDYITMNKVKKFDSKQKIHSCSPFAIAFNFNFNDADRDVLGIKKWDKKKKLTEEEKQENEKLIRDERINIITSRLLDYKKNSCKIYFEKDHSFDVILDGYYSNMNDILNKIKTISEFSLLTDKNYIRIYLRSIEFEIQKELYDKYLKCEIFNDEKLSYKKLGVVGFLTTFADKKPFLKHKTSSFVDGINQRFSREDALMLRNFESLIKRKPKCLPNPLPIVIDKREINKNIVKLFNEDSKAINYRELLMKLFKKNNLRYLPNYYLINYVNTKDGIVINDVDFVPLFRISFDENNIIYNVTKAGVKDDIFLNETFDTVFDFERIVVREIFNNSFVAVKKEIFTTNYFSEIDPRYVIGGDVMYHLIMKYRRAFYDYIYKSKTNAINLMMFEDMIFHSILSNVHKDEIKGRFEWNNTIKRKLNIWFSLYNLFNNNNLKENTMASKVPDLMSKMRIVAKGESNFEQPEDFAFGAGQIVSYLIDRSAASNKTYAMLEPFLQKTKSNQLQNAIAQMIAIYKHDINVCKGKFERLSAQVLIDNCDTEMKPLLKFFLAGCFCPCVIYESEKEK